ncbi:MAG: NADH-quinone oxidoreductase subunit NuoD [Dehalococcoidia bacterium]|nr:NADH-quinone oxidoreductase subunit NuoD [Dehalococcoidia bacterium]
MQPLDGDRELDTVEMTINMGPQHPSTHGVFRMVLQLEGERVRGVTPHIGYLHRGAEKLAEAASYAEVMIHLDRTEYLSALLSEQCYCMAVEKLANLDVPERAEYVRVILAEFTRMVSHCMFYGAFGADSGATTPFTYAFALREEIQQLLEFVSGARMFPNYFRPGGLKDEVPEGFEQKVRDTLDWAKRSIDDFDRLLSQNEIFLARTRGVATITAEEAINWGLSGPVLRSTGMPIDVRRAEPYSIYDRFDFDIPVGTTGDCYERYLVRLEELRQSVRIIEQALADLPDGPILGNVPKSLRTPAGECYQRVENSRGDFGVYIVSEQNKMEPYRVKYRSPSYCNLQALEQMMVDNYVADTVLVLGSVDIVLGEVDR